MDAVGTTRLAAQPAWDRDRDFLPASPGAPPAEGGGPGFRDLLASLNPLQHIPVIGAIYRHVTGEKAHPAAQVVGGLVFGGPIGMMLAALGATVEQATGKSPLQIALDVVRGTEPLAVAAAPAQEQAEATATVSAQEDAGTSATRQAPAGEQAQPPAAPPADPASPPRPAPARALAGEEPPAAGRPAVPGARDLSFYQAHAGSRLPPAATTSSPVGNAAARLASLAPSAAAL
ncbi:MAG: hypothetical protein ACKOUS_04480, partial [Alphaproteobacteria bacterium]